MECTTGGRLAPRDHRLQVSTDVDFRAAGWPADLLARLDAGGAVVVRLPGRGVPYPPLLRAIADAGRVRRIGRPSRWGNPWPLPAGADHGARADVIARYRAHLLSRPDLMDQLPTLAGCALGCRCWPLPCHGDVLAELVAALPGAA